MIDFNMRFLFSYIFVMFILVFPNYNDAKEILIYADKISYDKNQNIVAKGNAKIFQDNQLIISDLIIYEKINNKILLPVDFTYKDKSNNFYTGNDGFFSQDLNYGEFNNPKIRLNDGSRIIGRKIKRDGDIDIISKGVYTPCKSRIKIANFICPTWQLEGEKILHDNKNLFLYQKHSKMRVLNTPVFYVPYLVTPSPLRKERKSGFLSPALSLNFFDTKTSQSLSFPFYFNLDQDKELLFTPLLNYGGGVDSSQRFLFDYNQILSGGSFNTNLNFDSNFENKNSNEWLSNASLITNYKKNIDTNYKIEINSALQTSKDYIQITKPNDDLSYTNSLSTSIDFEGYNLRKIDDFFKINLNLYQSNQEDEDDKTIPIVLPNIKYFSGINKSNDFKSTQTLEFYNIFRDTHTSVHSQNQQKISHKYKIESEMIKYNSKIVFESEIYNQIFNTENKLLASNNFHSGNYYRLFPIIALSAETPFKLSGSKNNLTFRPKGQLVLAPENSNTSKLSNEDSTNNNFGLDNSYELNRYSGNDKMDNSKRLNLGFSSYNDNLKLDIFQSYEFTDKSDFHKEQGNDNNLSDLLGSLEFNNIRRINYNFRYDLNSKYLKNQSLNIKTDTKVGNVEVSYLDQQKKSDGIITKDAETINYNFFSKKIAKYSKINFSGLYDLKKEINTEYSIGYSYFDECFGINLDFYRKSYNESDLKPQDILTLMFSFKNIGSYKSSNLIISDNEKTDVEWENISVDNNLYEKYE